MANPCQKVSFEDTDTVNICIGLAPSRTSNVGQGQCQVKFLMVGRMGGRRTADAREKEA